MKDHKIETTNMEETNNHHTVVDIDPDQLEAINRKIAAPPTLLSKSAGHASCSIFRVPKSFKDTHGSKLYEPQIVSIGPLHRGGGAHLKMMEEHKYHYLGHLLSRTGLPLTSLLQAVGPLVKPALECYSEAVAPVDNPEDLGEFLEMLVVDGCFVVELFRKVARLASFEADDPIASMSWIFPALLRDLHRLENQVPFFVLQKLFDVTEISGDRNEDDDHGEKPTLASLCLEFFNYTLQRPVEVLSKYKDVQPKHLLDLLRSSLITPDLNLQRKKRKRSSTATRVIPPISKLRRAGIQLRPGKSETFLAVKFRKGVIQMPTVTFDDFVSSLFANCVAYEQCHKNSSTHFTTYATLIDCLVNTTRDVEYLCDHNILENYFGTESEIATFINSMGKDVAFDIDECYLASLFDHVNSYYKTSWHVYWADFKYTYFSSPWSFISALAAFVLLVLTVLQTLYTVYPYYKPS